MISDADCERIANSAETWQDVIRAAYVMGATGYQDTHLICSRCGQVRHVSAFRLTTTGKLIKACMKCEASVRRWNANRLAKSVPEPAKA